MSKEADVITARGVHELGQLVRSLSDQGFDIVTVIDTQNGDYHVVAKKDDMVDLANAVHDAVFNAVRSAQN